MSILFINYHRTDSTWASDDVYVLTHQEFRHQVHLIRESGVAPLDVWSADTPAAHHRLGLTFDDGYTSDLANAEFLASAGLNAWFFVSTANIGKKGYLDEQEIRELASLGMRVGSHSHEHVRLNTLAIHEARQQIVSSKVILEDILGRPVDGLAFPGGGYSRAVVAASANAGFRFLMSTDWGIHRKPLQQAANLVRRNNILRRMADDDFLQLVTLGSLYRRQLQFAAKQVARALLPKRAYQGLRNRVG